MQLRTDSCHADVHLVLLLMHWEAAALFRLLSHCPTNTRNTRMHIHKHTRTGPVQATILLWAASALLVVPWQALALAAPGARSTLFPYPPPHPQQPTRIPPLALSLPRTRPPFRMPPRSAGGQDDGGPGHNGGRGAGQRSAA